MKESLCVALDLWRTSRPSLAIIPVIHGSSWPAVSSGKWIVNIVGEIMAFGPFIFSNWQVQLPRPGWASTVPHCELITPNVPNVLQPLHLAPAVVLLFLLLLPASILPAKTHPSSIIPLCLYVYIWFSGIISFSENLCILLETCIWHLVYAFLIFIYVCHYSSWAIKITLVFLIELFRESSKKIYTLKHLYK